MSENILHTRVCDLLGIKYPIILAGMGSQSGPTLAAAVSNAGGLGVIGAAMVSPEHLRYFIRKCRSLTDKPFGVDLLLPMKMPKPGEGEDWTAQIPKSAYEFVDSVMKEFHIPEPTKVKRDWSALGADTVRRQIEVILEEKVPVFASGLGDPGWFIPDAHAQGMKILAMVGNVKNAMRVVESGVDIVGAQGYEGGGHTGRIGTLALIPQVVDAVKPVPVIAAGGIADGRGLAAALALGAEGVWVGTAFLATPEAMVDHIEIGRVAPEAAEKYKQRLLQAGEEDTKVSKVFTGKTARGIANKMMDVWEKRNQPTLPMPLQGMLIDKLVGGAQESAKEEFFAMFAGQICGMIREIKPAKQIVEEMVEGAVGIFTGKIHNDIKIGRK